LRSCVVLLRATRAITAASSSIRGFEMVTRLTGMSTIASSDTNGRNSSPASSITREIQFGEAKSENTVTIAPRMRLSEGVGEVTSNDVPRSGKTDEFGVSKQRDDDITFAFGVDIRAEGRK